MLIHISQSDLLKCFEIIPSFTVPVFRAFDYLVGVEVDASEEPATIIIIHGKTRCKQPEGLNARMVPESLPWLLRLADFRIKTA
jgi:hypothetical protein